MIKADNFVYLERYNIESYLIYRDAIIQYMRPKLKRTFEETERALNLDAWLNKVSPFLKNIFALHCIVQKKCLNMPNVSRGPACFFTSKGLPDENVYNNYKNEIASVVDDLDDEIIGTLSELESIYGTQIGSFVCGKYYICGLKLMLNSKLKKKFDENELKAGLISHIKAEELKYVETLLLKYMGI